MLGSLEVILKIQDIFLWNDFYVRLRKARKIIGSAPDLSSPQTCSIAIPSDIERNGAN